MAIKIRLTIISLFIAFSGYTQQKGIYDPAADALEGIKAAVDKASAENKFVLVQAGGNWCSWCREFERISKTDGEIDSLLKGFFVVYHLNWSKENENRQVFARYGYPQRFGFPVFLILDTKGERLHTQNSEYLENGKSSYDLVKVREFLRQWAPDAVNGKPNNQ